MMDKLHLYKTLINQMIKTVKVERKEPKHKISKLLMQIASRVEENYKIQTGIAKEAYSDENFKRFLDFIRDMLIFISEEDPHYRGWLAYFVLTATSEINREYEKLNPKKYYDANRDSLPKLSLKDPRAKPIMFLHSLIEHGMQVKKVEKL